MTPRPSILARASKRAVRQYVSELRPSFEQSQRVRVTDAALGPASVEIKRLALAQFTPSPEAP